jgi:leader peptidase (prepilin peptidase)/N-methyltransferase
VLDARPELLILFALALGGVVGSFLNVVIHRLPRGESLAWPGSHCPSCASPIPAWANVPIVSWLALRGRCAACGAAIPARYVLVELATALLFAALAARWGAEWRLLVHGAVGAALIAAAFIDAEHRIIPNSITLPGLALGLLWAAFASEPALLDAVLGVLLVGGGMWGISAAAERFYGQVALGMGDVKLVAMLGAFLGLQPALGVVALGSLLGLAQAAVWMTLGRAGRRTPIPFGPALAGAGIAHLYAPNLVPSALRAVGAA